MTPNEIVRFVQKQVAIASDNGKSIITTNIRFKKKAGTVDLEREFVNATGKGGNNFIDGAKAIFEEGLKWKCTDSGERGDYWRNRAAHFVTFQLPKSMLEGKSTEDENVSPEVRAKRKVYAAMSKTRVILKSIMAELRTGKPLFSGNVKQLLDEKDKTGLLTAISLGLKGQPQHHNEPKKLTKEEKAALKAKKAEEKKKEAASTK